MRYLNIHTYFLKYTEGKYKFKVIFFGCLLLFSFLHHSLSKVGVVVPHYKYCYIIYNTTITSILFSVIIAFLVVMLLHLTVSRKSRNNLELAAKN